MSNFVKLSEVKEQKLKQEEMKRVKGGYIDPSQVMHYGVVSSNPK
jgi:natural product precursor